MMDSKMIEVRDNMTKIVVIATRMRVVDEVNSERSLFNQVVENKFLRNAGYSDNSREVILTNISTGESTNDPYKWTDSRTMKEAHKYIRDHFDEIPNGWVVDVQYILEETCEMKVPEYFNIFTNEGVHPSESIKFLPIDKVEFSRVLDSLKSTHDINFSYDESSKSVVLKTVDVSRIGSKVYELLQYSIPIIRY